MNSALIHSSLISTSLERRALHLSPCLPPRRSHNRRRGLCVKATSTPYSSGNTASESKNPPSVVAKLPRSIWRRAVGRLSNFGVFAVFGTVLFVLSLAWLRGFQLRSKFRKYVAIFEFDRACGISIGTPVRIGGVDVGNVVSVNPSLRSIEAAVEVEDDNVIIPRNSLIEVNQSGLLMETLIEITPRNPVLVPSAGPLDEGCVQEGLIVCDRQKMRGQRGANLDELVGIFTRVGREVEGMGVRKTFSLAEQVVSVIEEEAQPLLQKVEAMADEVEPLLAQVLRGGLLNAAEDLTKSLTKASDDLRKVHSYILTPDNTELIQDSVQTLVQTLKNIEGITSDISEVTGDQTTRNNLKLLIKSLSRLL